MTVTASDDRLRVARESPLAPGLDLLFRRHEQAMHVDTPPESVHMLPRVALEDPGIAFYVLRDRGQPLAMGAIKHIGAGEGEIKSMHVLAEARGRGLSVRMLDALLDHARRSGLARVCLETGVQPSFSAARALYRRAGFVTCGPFGSYRPDPNSLFMALPLSRH